MICDCMIGSSAVVGSSASSIPAFSASAMAITARWRMPPENMCGNSVSRAAGRPTRANISSARVQAVARPTGSWARIASTI